VIELMILGFLADGPLHGYELRRRMEQLHGYARTISDGTLYPAITRLVADGLITRQTEPGKAGGQRHTLHLTDTGRQRLAQRLRDATGHDITDGHRFFVVLAFLSKLPDPEERDAVLRRRLAFLSQPASFFYDGDKPLRAADITDPYRQGILISARATSRAERAWLRERLDPPPTETGDRP
jgi:DNA-binding PadR family transcriptional regulator